MISSILVIVYMLAVGVQSELQMPSSLGGLRNARREILVANTAKLAIIKS